MALWIGSNAYRKINGVSSISVRSMTSVFKTSSSQLLLKTNPKKIQPVNFLMKNQYMRKSYPGPSLFVKNEKYCTQAGPNKTGGGKERTERKGLSVVGRMKLWIKEQKQLLNEEKGSQASVSAVRIALLGNILNTMGKSMTFVMTGSITMLSETLHSLGDVANQSLLFFGVIRSQRPATQEYPYGFEGELFIYALISATGIFFCGACFSLYSGFNQLFHPGELEDIWIGLGFLLFSGCIEATSFTRGMIAVKIGARESDMGIIEYIRRGSNPTGVAVVLEDGVSLIGLVVATGCLSLSYLTGNPYWDGIGSITIGTLLGFIAAFLINKNVKSLSSRSVPAPKRNKIIELLIRDPAVSSVHHVKVVQRGIETISVSAEIEYNGDYVARKYLGNNPQVLEGILQNKDNPDEVKTILVNYGNDIVKSLGDEVDRIEKELKTEVPEAKFVDLESN